MATSDSPLSVPNVTLAVARGNSGGTAGTVTVAGSGFGPAPNVVLWRDFSEGVVDSQIQAAPPTSGLGTLSDVEANDVYGEFKGRKVLKGWSADVQSALVYVHSADFNRYRACFSVAVPAGLYFPGTKDLQSTVNPDRASLWKLSWLMKNDRGDIEAGSPDLSLPTVVGGFFEIEGNDTDGSDTRFIGSGDSAGGTFSFDAYNLFSYVAESNIANPATVAGKMVLTHAGSLGVSELVRTDVPVMKPFAGATYTDSTAFFDRWKINPWASNVDGFPEQGLYSDLYLAVESTPGANDFVQCAFLGDAAVYANCTELRPVKASAWSDTEITIPNPYGLPHYHIVKPDGSVVSGATA